MHQIGQFPKKKLSIFQNWRLQNGESLAIFSEIVEKDESLTVIP